MSAQTRITSVGTVATAAAMNPILGTKPLGFPWPTIDPFLFCVYHDDLYPKGKADMTPDASLAGRNMGQDFEGIDGWRMYHGMTVPGFPSHPHRGFETVTIVRKGLIDHSDSLGATARFGKGATADNGADNGAEIGVVSADPAADVCGDVQWLTAGKGIVHSEMFPLLNEAGSNPLELFQIWLNLPASHKMVAPHFTMFWDEKIPRWVDADAHGKTTAVACVAGRFSDDRGQKTLTPLAPPPDSWASQPGSDLAIWTLKMQAGATWTLPRATGADTRRMLYFFKGASVTVGGQAVNQHAAIELNAGLDVELTNIDAAPGAEPAEFLVLQGKPINEPVAQYGPFVMNTQAEIHQAFADYRRTEFGGWPFPDTAPVHGRETKRFAKHADGVVETTT